tara:strand:+ start:1770 stop:2993 length:1224 start_codon:yes stop_codon:yes gene_type:complete
MNFSELKNKIEKIIGASIWSRLFHWKSIVLIMVEIKIWFENNFSKYDELQNKHVSIAQEISDLKIDYKAQQKINEDLKTQIQILKNEKEILAPLKIKNIELTNALNDMKQEKNAKDAERDAVITKYEQFENNAREREEKKQLEAEQKLAEEQMQLKRKWQDHEEHVNQYIKLICQEESITFIEEWHHEKKPDNVIKICNEYIVFDAKSPRNEDMGNFPTYIKTQVTALSKYAKHKDVKKHLFLVVPENTISELKVLTYNDSNYCVHVISPQSIRITMWSLKQIELYEFADKLSPEDRENLARAFAGSMNYIKRIIQINSDMSDEGIQLTEQMIKLIAKDSLKGIKEKALEFEKGDVINPSKQNRGKIIDLEKEQQRHKEIKFKAETRTIIQPSKKLDESQKKEIDSK